MGFLIFCLCVSLIVCTTEILVFKDGADFSHHLVFLIILIIGMFVKPIIFIIFFIIAIVCMFAAILISLR